jgi:peptide/nickel transport system permease protein
VSVISTSPDNPQDYGSAPRAGKKSTSQWIRKVNWPLVIGGIILIFILLLAIKGPDWAQQDPMQENYAKAINGKITRPPYPPFTLPEFPLGTDQFGRDLLSRILWGVRPTMMIVAIVAAVRLISGIVLGFMIGWSNDFRGKILDTILSVALTIPVLIVALMGISAVGISKGLWAFVFGLALTGWAETARVVSTQTRIVRSQEFIEAAQALGASDWRIFIRHVLPQISPLVWMLLAFEVSATLFVISELGFLGYYIGGGAWIEISDFVMVNTTGLPELGQMLSTALVSLVKPMALIVVGSFIFLSILGFNLLGEGFRLRLDRQTRRGYQKSPIFHGKFGYWLEDHFSHTATDWWERNATRVGVVVMALVFVLSWTIWWQSRPVRTSTNAQAVLPVPGGMLWATEKHDPQGTYWVPNQGPKNASVAWTYIAEGGIQGGPVLSNLGNIYITTQDQKLIALDPSRNELWKADLPVMPVRSPAIGPQGDIYVSDEEGGLSKFSTDGDFNWRFLPLGGREATSGPIVASDGNIYYTRVDHIQAVSPEGEGLWEAFAHDAYVEESPILSAGEAYIFLYDGALAASNGAKLALQGLPVEQLKFTTPAFFVGANGKTYLRTGNEIYGWSLTESGVNVDPVISWNYQNQVVMPPVSQGAAPDDTVWMFYSMDYGDTRLVWLDKNSKMLWDLQPAERQSHLMAIDKDYSIYICSENYGVQVNCKSYAFGSNTPRWNLDLGEGVQIIGGALAPARFYVVTSAGILYAVGPGAKDSIVEIPANEIDTPTAVTSIMTPPQSATPTEPAPSRTPLPDIPALITSTPQVSTQQEYLLFMPTIYR